MPIEMGESFVTKISQKDRAKFAMNKKFKQMEEDIDKAKVDVEELKSK